MVDMITENNNNLNILSSSLNNLHNFFGVQLEIYYLYSFIKSTGTIEY